MIWIIEPTSPWRLTAAEPIPCPARPAATADIVTDKGDRSPHFLDQFDPSDRALVEATLLQSVHSGAGRCVCRMAPATDGTGAGTANGTVTSPLTGTGTATLAAAGTGTEAGARTEGETGVLEISRLAHVGEMADSSTGTLVARWTATSGEARVVDDRSMRQFLGAISHDLRTPLNGVLGMSRLLLDSGLREDQVDYARTIDSCAEQLLTVIEDLLEFATLDTRTTLHPVDVDPRTLVQDEIAFVTPRAAEREIEVCALVSADVPEIVEVDEARLRQVLGYALEDGIARTAVGDVILRVGFDGAHLRFDVTVDEPTWADAPRGQAAYGHREAAGAAVTFGPGADASPRAAVCRHLVSIMDGVIDQRTDPHGGVSHGFTVRVTPRPAPPVAAPQRFVSLEGRRVLCVDDEAVSRRVLLERLRGWQLSVEVADEAHAALTMMKVASAAGAPFELAIIDLRLPGVDGLALARMIKADPVLQQTRLILLTGYPARGQAEMAIEAGIDAYLQKPVREAPLRAALDALFDPEAAAAGRSGLGANAWRAADEEARSAWRPRVLVAEDHPLNQKVTVQLLEKLGCRVDVVSTGEDAVSAVGRTPYHLVLLDSRLPSALDGAGATRAIRQLADSAASTPIIALAREEDEAGRRSVMAAGVNDVMPKPLRLGVLREKLAHWIAAAPPR